LERDCQQVKEEKEKLQKECDEIRRDVQCLEERVASLHHDLQVARDDVIQKGKHLEDVTRKLEVLGDCLTSMATENEVCV
jgi:hypothetical protein